MDLRSKDDIISGACLAAFGLYVTFESFRLDYLSEYGPGPGFLPLWLGIGLCTLALYLIAANVFRPASQPSRTRHSWVPFARALGGWLGLMFIILFLPRLGFTICLALLTVFLVLALERRSIWSALTIAFGLALGFHLVFVFALGLSLPTSRWGF